MKFPIIHKFAPKVDLDLYGNTLEDYKSVEFQEVIEKEKKLIEQNGGKINASRSTGLALSGGGIRSASYCIGALQKLDEMGILRKFTYVSAVSGGGYLGASMLAQHLALTDKSSEDQFKFPYSEREADGTENAFLKYIRRNASYLAPDGFVDNISMVMVVIYKFILHSITLLPFFLLISLLVVGHAYSLQSIFGAGLVEFQLAPKFLSTHVLSIGILMAVGFTYFFKTIGGNQDYEHNLNVDNFYKLCSRIFIFFLFVCLLESVSYYLFKQYINKETVDSKLLIVTGITILTLVIASRLLVTRKSSELLITGSLACVILITFVLLIHTIAKSMIIYCFDTNIGWVSKLVFVSIFLVSSALLWSFSIKHLDLNKTSLHSFYRNRLSKAFLFYFDRKDQGLNIDPNYVDGTLLSDLKNIRGPYLILNATVNTPGSTTMTQRPAESFIFTPLYCGSRSTEYVNTKSIEATHLNFKLASAMAISGAAISPNMGIESRPMFPMLLSLFNVRLGYWLYSPHKLVNIFKKRSNPSISLIKQEIFSTMDPKEDNYIYLSDGGHFDNLGVYELLMRRCDVVLSIDAGRDIHSTLNSLANIQHFVNVEHNIQILFDEDDLQKSIQKKGFICGEIHYPDTDTVATFMYIKPNYQEAKVALHVNSYKHSQGRHFPQESTGDQFFTYNQFEAYRSLGYSNTQDACDHKKSIIRESTFR